MKTEQILALLIAERDRVSRAIDALGSVPTNRAVTSATTVRSQRRRHLSAAGRLAIAEAARRRWAAVRASKGTAKSNRTSAVAPDAQTGKAAPKKRRISAAARKAMRDAAKRRWAAIKAAESGPGAKKSAKRKAA